MIMVMLEVLEIIGEVFEDQDRWYHSVYLVLSTRRGMEGEGGFEPNFQTRREGLTGSQFSEGVCWEREGGTFSGEVGSCSFHIKNTLKSEIFNDKKSF